MGRKDRIKTERRQDRENGIVKQSEKEHKSHDIANDLFNNPMTQAAMAALSEEDKERYRLIGEQLYGNIDYQEGKILNNMPPNMVEAVAYIESQLQSGMHPSVLDDNEKAILADAYGDEWYLEWGYVKEDLDNIITLQPTLKQKLS